MNIDDIASGLASEFRRGTLILLVLSRLREPAYGYDLLKQLEADGFTIEANTLYPLMRRLESQGLLKSQWDTGSAKPRKYYTLTPQGAEVFARVRDIWRSYSGKINSVIEDPDSEHMSFEDEQV